MRVRDVHRWLGGVRKRALLGFGICFCIASPGAYAASAYVRVSQVGYEAGAPSSRALLMSTADATLASFNVISDDGTVAYQGKTGPLLGMWANSAKLSYFVYPLDFAVKGGHSYSISVSGPVKAKSPIFAVDSPDVLYPGLLLNTLFFYQTQRDGAEYVPNALRDAPGHLKDKSAEIYVTPPLDDNDWIDNVPPAQPLVSAQQPKIDVSGGWWDAGDYEKYVETMSYTVALMEIGIRDFPNQMGAGAPINPPAPPNSVSYAGESGKGAPRSADFSAEANFGVKWLLKTWNSKTHALAYQVDNTQDWDYYGEGDPSSATGDCGGDYDTPYCLISEYDIWTLPQAADNYQQDGDSKPCDPLTTYYICNRPVFATLAPAPAAAYLSPNLAGRMAAAFAVCYQINREKDTPLAEQCLKAAQEVYALADTTYPDPADYGDATGCATCLVTITPFDGYPEEVWDDDMELGATELYLAQHLAIESEVGPSRSPHDDLYGYLKQAAQFAANYVTRIANPGYAETLNLYDVSGLAHFELYRAMGAAHEPIDFAISKAEVRRQLLKEVNGAIAQAQTDPWGFGVPWQDGDTTSHGAGLSVMASEAYSLTRDAMYDMYARRWLGNILGVNSWGASFIVGDGTTFPNCLQHQVANIAGALNGTAGGTPILWGAATEGPASYISSGTLDGMNLCPANGVDTFQKFNGNGGSFDSSQTAYFQDNVQSFSTTEPGIDLTATSFLMWSWRMGGKIAGPIAGITALGR